MAEVKLHKKGGYGFVKYQAHESAVKAIVGQRGRELHGRSLKCSWGRNISPSNKANASASSALCQALQVWREGGGMLFVAGICCQGSEPLF